MTNKNIKTNNPYGCTVELPVSIGSVLFTESRGEIVPMVVTKITLRQMGAIDITVYYDGDCSFDRNWNITFSAAAIGRDFFHDEKSAKEALLS